MELALIYLWKTLMIYLLIYNFKKFYLMNKEATIWLFNYIKMLRVRDQGDLQA